MPVSKLIAVCILCLSLGGCLTGYRPPTSGSTAQLKLSSPTYSSALLSSASLRIAIDRVDRSCKATSLGWIEYDPAKKDQIYPLTAGAISSLSVHYERNTLFVGNLNGGAELAFVPQPNHQYTLEFVTDDKAFDVKVYDETGGTRAVVPTKESSFQLCDLAEAART